MARLPVEILLLIIDALGHEYIQQRRVESHHALQSCAPSCALFYAGCRPYLFYTKHFYSAGNFSRSLPTFRRNFAIGAHFQELSASVEVAQQSSWVSCIPNQLSPMLRSLLEVRFTSLAFATLHPSFVPMFAIARHIERLILRSIEFMAFQSVAPPCIFIPPAAEPPYSQPPNSSLSGTDSAQLPA